MTNQELLTEKITEIVASALSENDIKPRVKEILEVLDEVRYASYLSGIREVVEAANELLLPSVYDGHPKRLEWQAKLKEWGIPNP